MNQSSHTNASMISGLPPATFTAVSPTANPDPDPRWPQLSRWRAVSTPTPTPPANVVTAPQLLGTTHDIGRPDTPTVLQPLDDEEAPTDLMNGRSSSLIPSESRDKSSASGVEVSPSLKGTPSYSLTVSANQVEPQLEENTPVNGTLATPTEPSIAKEKETSSLPSSSLPPSVARNGDKHSSDEVVTQPMKGAWTKPLKFTNASTHQVRSGRAQTRFPSKSTNEDDKRFPWAAKMDPATRNLYRATSPEYLDDGTPKVTIPSHVMLHGLENQREYVLGQFYRCSLPPGGLVHAVVNRIWGRKCRIFIRKLDESKFLFHIPDASTRAWVLQRGLWHVDDCLMFVAPWSSADTLDIPEISTIPVWVTLKNIPPRLYSIPGISHIASGLGAPMATHKPRLDPSLMGEAKILVEVELSKAFPPRIAAADKKGNIYMVNVEYAWVPSKCGDCGQLGHKASRCMKPNLPHENATIVSEAQTVINTTIEETPLRDTDDANQVIAPCILTTPSTTVATSNIIVTNSGNTKIAGHTNVEIGDLTMASGTVQRGLDSATTQENNILSEREVASVLANNRFSRLGNSLSDGDSLPSDEDSVDSDGSDSESGLIDHLTPSGQRLLRERPVQPSIKAKEAQMSSYPRGRGRRGRGSRGRGDRGRG